MTPEKSQGTRKAQHIMVTHPFTDLVTKLDNHNFEICEGSSFCITYPPKLLVFVPQLAVANVIHHSQDKDNTEYIMKKQTEKSSNFCVLPLGNQ